MKKLASLIFIFLAGSVLLMPGKSVNKANAAPGDVLYSEDFEGGGTGDGTLGSATVVDGHAVVQSAGYNDIYIPADINGKDNLDYQFDFTYLPGQTAYRYMGVKIWGLNGTAGAADSSVAAYLVEDSGMSFYFKVDFHDGTTWQSLYNNQPENGGLYPGMLLLADGQTANIHLNLYGTVLTAWVNGMPVFQKDIFAGFSLTHGTPFGSNFCGEEHSAGLVIDNIVVKEGIPTPALPYYSENFDHAVDANFGDKDSVSVNDGVLKSGAVFSRLTFPVVNAKPTDWTLRMDIKETSTLWPDVSGSTYVGVNVFDAAPGVTYEFTTEMTEGGGDYALIKGVGGSVVAHTGATGRNPILDADTAYTLEIRKFDKRVKLLIDNVEFLSYTDLNLATPSGFAIYTYGPRHIEFDNVTIIPSSVMPADDVLFSFDFNGMAAGDPWGTELAPFIVTNDLQIASNAVFNESVQTIDSNLWRNNWVLAFDITYPSSTISDGYFGFNLGGIGGDNYEFTIQKTTGANDYALVKKNGAEQAHSNGSGGIVNPNMFWDRPNFVVWNKSGDDLNLFINGVHILHTTLVGSTAPSSFQCYSYNIATATIDNIVYRENEFDLPLQSVELTASRSSISTLSSALLTTILHPSTATATEIKWYVDDVLVPDATGRTYTFASTETGEFDIKAVVDTIESNTLTITVTPPSDLELNSIYYENFDSTSNGTAYGGFTIVDGHANTANQVYGNYMYNIGAIQNWEMSYNVTFHGARNGANTYFGINIQGLVVPASREFEFNLMRGGTEEVGDKVIIKDTGVESVFNDSEVEGRMPDLTIDQDVSYAFRVVRWEDQLEIYVNDALAIKTRYAAPAVASRLFVYWYNSNGANVDFDDVVYREAEEITDVILPPQVDVESAYITANHVTADVGDTVILNVITEPSNATPGTYQWYVNGTLIEGATGISYTFTPTEGGSYVFTCLVDEITSDAKTITVNAVTPEEPADELSALQKGLIIGGSSAVVAGGGFCLYWFWIKKLLVSKKIKK